MSRLDAWNEYVTIYPEVTATSSDGNPMTQVSDTGIPAKAMIQVQAASGTSARRAEQDNEGFETEENYRLRLPRFEVSRLALLGVTELGPQAQVEWDGYRWSVVGFPNRFNGSSRTARHEYTIRRA